MTAIEERLSRCLGAMAEQVAATPDWDQVIADAETGGRSELDSVATPLRTRVLAVAAIVALVVGAGVFATRDRDDPTSVDVAVDIDRFVLPGERVLSRNPLTVQPAPAPTPRFDTSDLGTEVVVEPLTEIDGETQMRLELYVDNPRSNAATMITKITLLGSVEGSPYIQLITDGLDTTQPENGNMRMKTVIGDDGGFGSGDWVDPESMDLIGDTSAYSDGISYSMPIGDVVWEVPASTSIVTFESDDTQAWIRPIGGYAVFPAEFDDGEALALEALDADGRVIARHTQVLRYESSPSTGPQIGDRFDVIEGNDLAGNTIRIEPNNPTVLLFGAAWCGPCRTIADEALRLLDELDPSIRVFTLSSYTDPGEAWPADERWTQPKLELTTDIGGLNQVPTIIVLDGDNRIVDYRTGADGVLDALTTVNDLVAG